MGNLSLDFGPSGYTIIHYNQTGQAHVGVTLPREPSSQSPGNKLECAKEATLVVAYNRCRQRA